MEKLATDGAITVQFADVYKLHARAVVGDDEGETVELVVDMDAGHAIMLVGERTLKVPVAIPDAVQRQVRDLLNGSRLEIPEQLEEAEEEEEAAAE